MQGNIEGKEGEKRNCLLGQIQPKPLYDSIKTSIKTCRRVTSFFPFCMGVGSALNYMLVLHPYAKMHDTDMLMAITEEQGYTLTHL